MSAVDLSMNETPYPPLPGVQGLIEEGAGRLNRYPDHGARPLVAALAARLEVHGTDIVAGSGSAGLLQHLLQALGTGRHEVLVAEPAFEAYPLIISNAGARTVPVPLTGHRQDLASMA